MLGVTLTHLSDFSYLDRLMTNFAVIVWMMARAWKADRFSAMSLKNLLKFRLQTVVLYMLFGAQLAFLVYDGIVTRIKYEEGFYYSAALDKAGPKPSSKYSAHNKDMVFVADATLNVVFTLKNSALFLLIATFAQIASKELRSKGSFMSSGEFHAYTAWSFLSIVGYPILQVTMNKHSRKLYATVYPQIFYSFETLMTVALCQLTAYRLKKLRVGLPTGSSTRYRLEHYTTMLHCVSLCGLLDTFGLFSINVDILNEENRVIYKSKFLTDFFTKCFSFGICGVFVPAMLCLYPGERLAVRENTTQMEDTKQSGVSNIQSTDSPRTPRRNLQKTSAVEMNTKRSAVSSYTPSEPNSPNSPTSRAPLVEVVSEH